MSEMARPTLTLCSKASLVWALIKKKSLNFIKKNAKKIDENIKMWRLIYFILLKGDVKLGNISLEVNVAKRIKCWTHLNWCHPYKIVLIFK